MNVINKSISELDSKLFLESQKKFKLISFLKQLSNYENAFYQINTSFNKSIETMQELKNKINSLKLSTCDGKEIDVWDINPYRCKKYIIFCEGISNQKDNIQQQAAYLKFLESGWGVIAFDYRGRGKSSGIFSQKGALKDLKAIYEYVRSKKISAGDIGIVAHSMGCGVAIEFCSEHKITFLALINPFSKASDMVKEITKKTNLPDIVKFCIDKLPSTFILLQNKFDNEKVINKIHCPILMIHNIKDTIIPVEFARKLYKKYKHSNIQYQELNDNDHEINEEKINCCLNFLEKFI